MLSLSLAAGCSGGQSGSPKDFGPVDTSKAIKSEDATPSKPGVADDSSGGAASKK